VRTIIALGLAVVLTGCAAPASKPQPVAPTVAAVVSDLDTPQPSLIKFFSKRRIASSAMEADLHVSIADATRDSTAVVIAEISGPGPSRTVTGEVPSDVISLTGYRLKIHEVLAGKLPAKHTQELIIEFMGGADPTKYPRGKAIWFLHRKGTPTRHLKNPPPVDPAERDLYRILSSQGLFIQGQDGVIAPLAEKHEPTEAQAKEGAPADAAADGEQSPKLSDLATKIKKAGLSG
jgi:hypothetical protein